MKVLLVVAGRAHRHRDRRSTDADLQRLLGGDTVALARAGREADDVHLDRRIRRSLHVQDST